MIKKIRNLFLLFLLLLLLGFWSPWNDWDINFLQLIGIDTQPKLATLKVKSLAGNIDIFIDEQNMGSVTADDEFAEITTISKGEHLIQLKRLTEKEGIYYELSRKLNFEPGVEVVIAYDLGPSEEFSEGHILYTAPNFNKDSAPDLNIISEPDDVAVFLDDSQIGTTPLKELELDISKQHKVRFEKQGYDTLEFILLPESQEARDKLKGLSLQLEVNLFLQPMKLIKAN